MGKHVDRYSASKQETSVNAKVPKVDIEKMKPFKDIVARVADLELAIQDIVEKITGLAQAKKDKTEE